MRLAFWMIRLASREQYACRLAQTTKYSRISMQLCSTIIVPSFCIKLLYPTYNILLFTLLCSFPFVCVYPLTKKALLAPPPLTKSNLPRTSRYRRYKRKTTLFPLILPLYQEFRCYHHHRFGTSLRSLSDIANVSNAPLRASITFSHNKYTRIR